MKITDLVEKDDLLCDPNKDFAPYTGKVEGDVKVYLRQGLITIKGRRSKFSLVISSFYVTFIKFS